MSNAPGTSRWAGWRSLVFASVLLMVASLSLPVFAQQSDMGGDLSEVNVMDQSEQFIDKQLGGQYPKDLAPGLDPGTIISDENWSEVKDKTYLGHKISDLLTKHQEYMLKETNFRLRLGVPYDLKLDERLMNVTEEHAGEAKLDSQGEIQNYTAGIPFPGIMDDPKLNDKEYGLKTYWNQYQGRTTAANSQIAPGWNMVWIDEDQGYQKAQAWYFLLHSINPYFGSDNVGGPYAVPQDAANERFRKLQMARNPFSIKGLGLFQKRYYGGRFDPIWAYVKSMRRVRRVAGGGWFDPVGSSDFWNNNNNVLNHHPTWYDSYQVIDVRYILAVRGPWDAQDFRGNHYSWGGGSPPPKEDIYRFLDWEQSPHWNPDPTVYEAVPRKVYVIKAVPPDEHPQSKQLVYYDPHYNMFWHFEGFDKDGNFWRVNYFFWNPEQATYADKFDGWVMKNSSSIVGDYQKMHQTPWNTQPGFTIGPRPDVTAQNQTLDQLRSSEVPLQYKYCYPTPNAIPVPMEQTEDCPRDAAGWAKPNMKKQTYPFFLARYYENHPDKEKPAWLTEKVASASE